MMFSVGLPQLKRVSVIKFNDDNMCIIIIDSLKNHSHFKISEQIINRQKLNNNLKRKAVDDMFTKPSKIIYSELKITDIEFLITQDVKLIKRNVHNARAFYPTKITRHLFGITQYF